MHRYQPIKLAGERDAFLDGAWGVVDTQSPRDPYIKGISSETVFSLVRADLSEEHATLLAKGLNERDVFDG